MLIDLAEKGWVPDAGIRIGIRQLVKKRLRQELRAGNDGLIDQLRCSDVAIETDAANDQHYELPAEFFTLVLGEHLKYSSCYWDESTKDLHQAEQAMLELYAERAQLKDGQSVLDLGCGWGSFTLWAAARYPNSRFEAVSNSTSQRAFILDQACKRGLSNVNVRTADINHLELEGEYDRIVSVEMLEHVRNYPVVFKRMAHWLAPGGRVFVHVFCHRSLLYPFEDKEQDDWMSRHFFTGGLMPAADTFLHFQDHLRLEKRWSLPGTHYQRTARAWLEQMDTNHSAVSDVLAFAYGDAHSVWLQRWRMFFMACEEMFGYANGQEWQVCHYLFTRRNAI